MLTGLSLSSCVWDILRGVVDISDVIEIHCGFSWEGEFDPASLEPSLYWDGLWGKYPREEVMGILNQLKILPHELPYRELEGSTSRGHWMEGVYTPERFRDHDDRIPSTIGTVLGMIKSEDT